MTNVSVSARASILDHGTIYEYGARLTAYAGDLEMGCWPTSDEDRFREVIIAELEANLADEHVAGAVENLVIEAVEPQPASGDFFAEIDGRDMLFTEKEDVYLGEDREPEDLHTRWQVSGAGRASFDIYAPAKAIRGVIVEKAEDAYFGEPEDVDPLFD